jgi:ubiquinone/menaquinone biosynthesis C-methylase UbiE
MRETFVCPAAYAGTLLFGRSFLHKPGKILSGLIKKGNKVADIGCGPGFFLPEMSLRAGSKGKVFGVDIQEKMLAKAKKRIVKRKNSANIVFHKADTGKLRIPEKLDFALAFWMVHEVPDRIVFFAELYKTIKRGGKLLVVEPLVHVSRRNFGESLEAAREAGFKEVARPKIAVSRAILLSR